MSPATVVLDLEKPAAAVQCVALVLRPLGGWEPRAACRWVVIGPETDVLYGLDGEPKPKTAARPRTAEAICASSPVRSQCLQFALETREPYGICSSGWLTARERRDLLAARAWRLAVHATAASCDQGDPEAAKQWAAVLRLAERTWREATWAPLSLAAATDAE